MPYIYITLGEVVENNLSALFLTFEVYKVF